MNWLDRITNRRGEISFGTNVAQVTPEGYLRTIHPPNSLIATAVGVDGKALSIDLPAAIGVYQYISFMEIVCYNTAARVGGVKPVIVTSVNLPNIPSFVFDSAGVIGTSQSRLFTSIPPMKSYLVSTKTSIVCPGMTGILWAGNVFYSLAL